MPNLSSDLAILKTYPKGRDRKLIRNDRDGEKRQELDPWLLYLFFLFEKIYKIRNKSK
jgi:hypothetical protein